MPGVKLFDPFRRKRGTSRAEFSHYWITHHAELVKEFRRITRYVQSMRVADAPAGLGAPFGETGCDGCAETWHRDPASVAAMVDEPRFPDLMADEENFLDLERPRSLVTTRELLLDEHGFDERLRGVKVLLFVRRAPSLSQDEFAAAWTDDTAADLGRRLGVTRHIVCTAIGHVEREATDSARGADASADGGYDGVRELSWPSLAALEEGLAGAPDVAAALLRPETIDVAGSFPLVAHERIIVP